MRNTDSHVQRSARVRVQDQSVDHRRVPYDGITSLSYTLLAGRKKIRVKHVGGKVAIVGDMLPAREDEDEILAILSEKTGLKVERAAQWLRQFSLRSILLLTTVVAVLLGLRLWIAGPFNRYDLYMLAFLAFQAGIIWTIAVGPASARVFVMGLIPGGLLEAFAGRYCATNYLTQAAPNVVRNDEGWYPLTRPITRMLEAGGWDIILSLWPYFIAMALSGVICGTAALAVWYAIRYVMERKRRRRT